MKVVNLGDQELSGSSGTSKPVVFRVTNNLGVGGVQCRLRAVLPRLARDFEVHVVTYRQKGVFFDELPDHGVHTHFLKIPGKWSPVGIAKLSGLLSRHNAHIVHGHSLGGNIAGVLAGLFAGTPIRIGQVHNAGLHWYAKGRFKHRKQVIEEAMVHRLFTDKVLHVSRESLEYFRRETGMPREQLEVLHNGVDFSALEPQKCPDEMRRELGITPEKKIIGFVGRLSCQKGLDFMLEFVKGALASGGPYSFVIVGGAAEENLARLKEEFNALDGGENVIFTGEQRNVADYYSLFDVFLFTSPPMKEGMPGVALEACHFGLPLLARETAPLREISQYYPAVRFIEEYESPRAAISAALDTPHPDTSRFDEEFSIEAMAARTRQFYLGLIESKGAATGIRGF